MGLGALAGRRAAHGRDGPEAGADRRICVGTDGAAGGRVRVGMARRGGEHAGRGRSGGGAGNADGGAAALAHRTLPGSAGGGRAGPDTRRRFASTCLLFQRQIRGGLADHRRGDGPPLRPSPGRGGLADRQRVRLPRHGAVVLAAGAGALPQLAGAALWRHRHAQRALGQRVLEHGLRRLRADRPARGPARAGQPDPRARLAPLRLRRGAALQPPAGRRAARPLAGPHRAAQLHGLLRRVRPPRDGP